MDKLNIPQILDKFKKHLDLYTDIALSEYLGENTSTISTWRKRQSLQAIVRITELSEKHGLSLNFLFLGIGPIYLKDCEIQISYKVSEPSQEYIARLEHDEFEQAKRIRQLEEGMVFLLNERSRQFDGPKLLTQIQIDEILKNLRKNDNDSK
jgi:hypothetical protein